MMLLSLDYFSFYDDDVRKLSYQIDKNSAMMKIALVCLVGSVAAQQQIYDHDRTLLKPRPAAFNIGGEVS